MNIYYKKMNRMLNEILLKNKANQILSFLTLHPDKSFYDKEISENTGVSRGATNQALNDFFKNGLVSREKRGKAWFYSTQDQPLNKYFRIYENLIKRTELVNLLQPISKRNILFGSAANGADTSESDIDLFILSGNIEKVKDIIQKFNIERQIKPVIQTPLEYATNSEKDSAFHEQMESGIVLFEKGADEQRP